jgi:hypothetical protein
MRRSPSAIIAILFALAVTLLLGGTLGYVLKPATSTSAPARVVVLPSVGPGSDYAAQPCLWINHQKAC